MIQVKLDRVSGSGSYSGLRHGNQSVLIRFGYESRPDPLISLDSTANGCGQPCWALIVALFLHLTRTRTVSLSSTFPPSSVNFDLNLTKDILNQCLLIFGKIKKITKKNPQTFNSFGLSCVRKRDTEELGVFLEKC